MNVARSEIERLEPELERARPAQEVLDLAPEVDSLRELKVIADQGAAGLASLQAERGSVGARVNA